MTPQAPAFHPLSVGELLDAAIYVYRKNLLTLVGIAAVMGVPILVLQCAAAFFFSPFAIYLLGAFWPLSTNTSASTDPLVFFVVGLFAYMALPAVSGLISPIAIVFEVGALTFAVSEGRMGHRVSIGGAYRRALHRWISLLLSAILVQLNMVVAPSFLLLLLYLTSIARQSDIMMFAILVAFVPASILVAYFSVRWSFTTPAIVLENLGTLSGMRRSWCLTKKRFWRTWAVLLVAGVLAHLLTYAVFLGAQSAAFLLPSSLVFTTAVSSIGALVVGTVIQPLTYVVITLLYYDLRVRHEGYDLQLSLEQLKQSATAVATKAPA